MFERWKKHYTFVDDVNIITKLLLGVALFFFVIFVHNFDYMIYITLLLFILLLLFNGTSFKITGTLVLACVLFALLSSLFMILYGDGTHVLFSLGFIQISTESLVRGLHVSLRTISVSMLGILIALTSQIVMIFYSLMQHLKVKPKIAYAFMAAIRMVPLIFTSFIQLRRSLKMRYQMIDASNYRGLKRLKHLLIPILSQNIRRAHQLSVAMESKGFKDGPRTYYYKAPFSYKDILFVICVVAILIIGFYLSQYLPITGITDARVSGYTA
ncbi:energy-coupling factor transporter transmembrane component T family protein [Staphylococcus petrasii]|uniref:energy-coupling factor transporter transmembrane component T family protein n=1 Tax=Staphylococcus petrasii TaxID=1276936 RepID=UPI000CD054FC|nr:energy-coupling factor transporter transmembrane component T [Staphylococcus petrasii]PNZ83020.1 cobalt ABC transporter permease [Staphylococcus petrasii]TGA82389.1 energy-coupling factor transporter transmembrane protein EcfT [Staphylococcus petrasii]SUM60446.1 transmembrane component YkoC of energizing module of thiamin-regulated ECF transporter for hydroxymethylPyrimidine [Staphylococcus petrasii]